MKKTFLMITIERYHTQKPSYIGSRNPQSELYNTIAVTQIWSKQEALQNLVKS